MKRVIVLVISAAYWALTLGGRLASRNQYCVVLYYHGVSAKTAKAFAEQMAWLADRFEVVRLSDALTPRTRAAVCITFDDALENLLTNAIPVLTRLELPATIIAVSRNLAKPPQWEMTPGHAESNERTMSEAQLHILPHELIDVGSHTCTHPHLPRLSKEDVRRELCDSKSDL
ncbi:MAG: polysaccharide deacetylase family protein [Planctomycetes bacterium]|nr:polysaccharide deacetylase family protein [Planctomycetota bacterium]MBI3833260.1 polysaccharide deacetylase family protein [Planctomycetota bacterium]